MATAGWSIGTAASAAFPAEGTTLERYSTVLGVSEINSSFHRPHRASTWERWRDSVPNDFRFSAKIPKTISHQRKLVECGDLLAEFLMQVEVLGNKLAVLLLQLPPKLAFAPEIALPFLADLQARTPAAIAVEPRHASWFEAGPDQELTEMGVHRVAADPAICAAAARPGGDPRLQYWRLHGSPVMYRSSYQDRIDHYAAALNEPDPRVEERWCIFDNTASSAAILDALALHGRLS